jgi:hypothetical protein
MHLGPPSDTSSSHLPIGIVYNFSYFKCMLFPPPFICLLYNIKRIVKLIYLFVVRWVGHIVRVREKQNAYRVFVGKSEDKEPLLRRRWEYNVVTRLSVTIDGVWIDDRIY